MSCVFLRLVTKDSDALTLPHPDGEWNLMKSKQNKLSSSDHSFLYFIFPFFPKCFAGARADCFIIVPHSRAPGDDTNKGIFVVL